MKALTLLFLLMVTAKVLLVGYGNIVTQGVLPAAILLLVVLMLVLSPASRAATSRMVFVAPVGLMVLVFAVSGLVGVYNSLPIGSGVTAILRMATMFAVMLGAYLATLFGNQSWSARLLYVVFFVHIVAAIALYFAGVGYEIGGVFRPTGLTGRPQLIANIASFAIVYYLCIWIYVDARPALHVVVMLALGVTFIMLSGTLKNFIAVIIAAMIALASMRSRYRIAVLATGAVVLAIAIHLVWSELPIGARLSEAISAGITTDVAVGDRLESSLMWRVLHWKLLLTDWYLNYRWTGAGIGQVVMLDAIRTEDGRGFIAHSDWIGLFVELGPALFVLFVLAQIHFYAIIRRQCLQAMADFQVLRIGYLLFLIMSVAGNVMYSAAFMYLFWWVAGMTAAGLGNSTRPA